MNIFKELNKLPHTDINEVSYGNKKHLTDKAYANGHRWTAENNPASDTKIFFKGKPMSYWAEQYGVTIPCIFARLKKYGDPYPRGRAIDRLPTLFEGKSNREWADILKVSIHTIQKRRKNFGNPFYHGDRNYIGYGYKHPPRPLYEGKSNRQWAEELGITKGVVSKRLRAWGHPYNKTTCRQIGLL